MLIERLFIAMAICVFSVASNAFPAVIPVTDTSLLKGLSAYNWVCKDDSISSSVNGASITLRFKGTKQVALRVSTDNITTSVPSRFPILAWTVNGGTLQTHQLAAKEDSVPLSSGVDSPTIDLYIRGMSPFENRFSGDIPANAVKITGFIVDEGATAMSIPLPRKIWLNIGDSIMSGDGAAYSKGQGRPSDDTWAASEDGRASYGYLLARHYGYRESRIAYGGYDWSGGMANVPALPTLIDQTTSTSSRLHGESLSPSPDVVLINLGENGTPSDKVVIETMEKLRSRVSQATKVIVMIPVSGRARAEIARAFGSYKTASKDQNAYLVDLGSIQFPTCDGQHPTAEGHELICKAALPQLDAIVENVVNPSDAKPSAPEAQKFPLWSGKAPIGDGKFEAADAFITLHRPSKPNGTALVICPGGGYGGLVTGAEGHGIAQWLNQHGITGIVLEYRLPHGRPFVPLLDAQRAIRTVRANAKDWNIDPTRIGIIGFSAGGHLAATAGTHFDDGDPKAADAVDRVSCRPDFAILVYPVITMGPKGHGGSRDNLLGRDPKPELLDLFSNEKQVTDKTPPMFLAHARDDKAVPPENSQMMYDALKAHKVPAEYLELPNGGHGLNGYHGPSWDAWQARSLVWMAEQKLIPADGQ